MIVAVVAVAAFFAAVLLAQDRAHRDALTSLLAQERARQDVLLDRLGSRTPAEFHSLTEHATATATATSSERLIYHTDPTGLYVDSEPAPEPAEA